MQLAHAMVETTTHSVEKETRLLRACARFPIARMVVSAAEEKEKNNDVHVLNRYSRVKPLHAPVAPNTPMRATLDTIPIWVW